MSLTKERYILHSDMNSFYASVETMLNPELHGKAVAVCGSTEERHGIVLAKSEKAKKAGITTGMVNWEAQRRCKDLIIVPPQYEQYLKYSKLAHQIYYRYTDLVEPYGMDECWLDVTGQASREGTAMRIAEEIRRSVREELGLTVSIGVSFNKVFAKLGSDMKKPDAITETTRENFKKKVWELPVSDLLYCGPATTRTLNSKYVYTIGELAQVDEFRMKTWFGVTGLQLLSYARGEDTSAVMHKDFVSPIKSIGHGITCTADLNSDDDVWKVMLELSQDVGHKLRTHELNAAGVQVTIRTQSLVYYQYQGKLPLTTQLPHDIAKTGFDLFQKNYTWNEPIRSVTVRAIDLDSVTEPQQMSLEVEPRTLIKKEKVQDAIEEIRGRFGKSAVTVAALLKNDKLPCYNSNNVRMPGLMYK